MGGFHDTYSQIRPLPCSLLKWGLIQWKDASQTVFYGVGAFAQMLILIGGTVLWPKNES